MTINFQGTSILFLDADKAKTKGQEFYVPTIKCQEYQEGVQYVGDKDKIALYQELSQLRMTNWKSNKFSVNTASTPDRNNRSFWVFQTTGDAEKYDADIKDIASKYDVPVVQTSNNLPASIIDKVVNVAGSSSNAGNPEGILQQLLTFLGEFQESVKAEFKF